MLLDPMRCEKLWVLILGLFILGGVEWISLQTVSIKNEILFCQQKSGQNFGLISKSVVNVGIQFNHVQ